MDVQSSGHPILTAGTIVNGRAIEMNIGTTVSTRGLRHDGVLADPDRFVHGETVTVTAIVLAIAIVGAR